MAIISLQVVKAVKQVKAQNCKQNKHRHFYVVVGLADEM